MELKELQEILDKDEKKGKIVEKAYWEELWQHYIEEKSQDYRSLEVKDAIPKLISDMNLRERRNITNCNELGVDIRVGDICYIDFGEAYIYEIGFQHFGIIMTLFHNKSFVVPMGKTIQKVNVI